MEIISQLILNSIIAGSIYAFIALGFNLIYGATKFFNLSHGTMAAIGAYTVFYFGKVLEWNISLSIIIGILFAGGIGYSLDKLVYSPLRKRKASNMVMLVASLGLFTMIQAIIAILFTSQFQVLSNNVSGQRSYEIFGGIITQIQLITLVSVSIIFIGFILFLKYTMFGKTVKAISDDEEVSRIMGINTNKIIGYVFFIGSAVAGLGGILAGFDVGIQPTMGFELLLKGIISAIIGGVGSIYGAFIGAFLLGFAENFGIWHISGEWKDSIAFGLLILFLIFRPTGIIKK